MYALSIRPLLVGGLLVLLSCGGGGGVEDEDVDDDRTPPTIASVRPDTGFATGGTTITVGGSGYLLPGAGVPRVAVGGAPASDVDVLSDTTLTCVLPAGLPGSSDVDVETDHGSDRLPSAFEYFGYPPNFASPGSRIESDPTGASESWLPDVCCADRTVYVTWNDARNGEGDIYLQRSTDAGVTWLPADVRLDTDTAGIANSWNPVICCDGDLVCVAWNDVRDGAEDIRANCSVDGGQTWLASDRRLDTDPAGTAESRWPQVCCAGNHVYVTWVDLRAGNEDIYFNRSTDGGASWLASDVRVDHVGTDAAATWNPRIACDGENVFLAWTDKRHGEWDIWFNRSTDGGTSWQGIDRQLDTDGPGASGAQIGNLCCEGERVYVIWLDQRDDVPGSPITSDIYLNRSRDSGVTWLASDVQMNTDVIVEVQREEAHVCCSEGNVYVVWRDRRNGFDDVFARTSADGGVTWQASERRLDTDPAGSASSYQLRIACEGPNAFVAWHDNRSPGPAKFINATPDQGLTWLATDVRVSEASTSVYSQGLDLACSGARAYVVWLARPISTELDILFSASSP